MKKLCMAQRGVSLRREKKTFFMKMCTATVHYFPQKIKENSKADFLIKWSFSSFDSLFKCRRRRIKWRRQRLWFKKPARHTWLVPWPGESPVRDESTVSDHVCGCSELGAKKEMAEFQHKLRRSRASVCDPTQFRLTGFFKKKFN